MSGPETGSRIGPKIGLKIGLRIGLILYGGLDGVSGGYLYDRKMVEGLGRRGAEIEIISLPWRHYGRHLCDNFSSSLLKRIQGKSWDVLLQDELNHPSLFRLNRLLKKKADLPVLSIVHHLRSSEYRHPLMNRLYRSIEKRYLRTVDGFVVNSRTTAAAVHEILGREEIQAGLGALPPSQVIVYPGRDHIRPGIEEKHLRRKVVEGGPLRILFLGNLIFRKGLHVLIEALSALPRNQWRLTVVGDMAADPAYTRKIVRKIERLRLKDAVDLVGRVQTETLPGLFAAHHCFAMPSFYEGFGIACLEAMGFGLPVIASNAGAGPEWIRDEGEGFLVPPGESTILARRIGLWIENRQLLLEMGRQALQTFHAHPTWDEGAEKVDRFIRARCRPGSESS